MKETEPLDVLLTTLALNASVGKLTGVVQDSLTRSFEFKIFLRLMRETYKHIETLADQHYLSMNTVAEKV